MTRIWDDTRCKAELPESGSWLKYPEPTAWQLPDCDCFDARSRRTTPASLSCRVRTPNLRPFPQVRGRSPRQLYCVVGALSGWNADSWDSRLEARRSYWSAG